jgi:hypothetical protein
MEVAMMQQSAQSPLVSSRPSELADEELDAVSGGDGSTTSTTTCTGKYASVTLAMRKSAGNEASGVMF